MSDLYEDILKIIEENSDILFGISNIGFCEYKSNYKCTFVFAVPHTELLSINSYKEEKLKNLIWEARDRINLLLEEFTTILKNTKFIITYHLLHHQMKKLSMHHFHLNLQVLMQV